MGRPGIRGGVLASWLCFGAVAGCLPAPDAPPGPIETVQALHADIARGDMEAAHRLYDFAARYEEMLGDIWRDGSADDRARALELAGELFDASTRETWNTFIVGRQLRLTQREVWPDTVWVWATAEPPQARAAAPSFVWRYRLRLEPGGWRIVQRESVIDGVSTDTGRFWAMAGGAIARDLGRAPTLGELIANLPSYQGRVRARTFKVPDLSKARPPGARPAPDLEDGP
ncbi:MAG: hypothetical protein H6744_08610 [Deltaproteobacteria bacterium]|nr:hypothetical protein [Deltaproteobacteria bacterium]MCB9786739.1 hypothetical protein [Deltaproteobacteria bacterium]